jgi:hypothetical protein
MVRIIVKTNDIQAYYGVNISTAAKMITKVKKALKLKRKDVIDVHQFAAYHNISYESLLNAMNSKNINEYIKKTNENK